jgi:hypothetical protein
MCQRRPSSSKSVRLGVGDGDECKRIRTGVGAKIEHGTHVKRQPSVEKLVSYSARLLSFVKKFRVSY